MNDRVRSVCRLALTQAQAGHYTRALSLLDDLQPVVKGVLKAEQRVKAFAALIHLRRQIHRYVNAHETYVPTATNIECSGDTEASDYYLSQLRPVRSFIDPDIIHEIDLLEIESLIQREDLETALHKVGGQLAAIKGRGTDLAQRLYFLILKARIFAAGGQASKGFSIALRATSTAERHLLLPVYLEGLAVLSRILIDLSEFEAARSILEFAIPHALLSNNAYLVARMFRAMGEACVGFAGYQCADGSKERTIAMRRAADLIERGRLAYERTEDLSGQLDCLLIKEKIAVWDGDETTAQLADEQYLQLLADSQVKE